MILSRKVFCISRHTRQDRRFVRKATSHRYDNSHGDIDRVLDNQLAPPFLRIRSPFSPRLWRGIRSTNCGVNLGALSHSSLAVCGEGP